MSGKRGSSGSAARPPESRKRDRTGGPLEKPVSYIFICDDDEGLSCHDNTLSLRNSGSESARVSRSGSPVAKQNDNLCGEKTSIVVFDGNVGRDGKIGMEIADVGARCRSAGDGDDDVLLLSMDGCVGLAEGNAGPSNENLLNFGDRYGALVGSLPMKWDISGVDREYKQFLELLRVDGTAYSVELPLLDGLSFILEYEKGAPVYSSGRPRPQERCGSRKRKGKEGSAAPVGGQTSPHTSRGSREQNGKEGNVVPVGGQTRPETSRGSRKQNGKEGNAAPVGGGQTTPEALPGSQKGNGKEGNAASVGTQTGTETSRGSREQNGKEAVRVLMKCAMREHVNAHDDRGPKGRKRKFSNVSIGVKKGSQLVKMRAFEPGPGTCKPNLHASRQCSSREHSETKPHTSRGFREQNGEEAARVLKKCARREHVEAHDDRGPKGRKGKFSDVSTGLKRGSQLGKTRAFESGTCKPGLQSSKWHAAESVGLPNAQVRDEEMPDEAWLAHLNSLNKDGNQSCGVSTGVKKGSRHVKTRAFEPSTCKLDVQAGKLLVAESARSRKSQVKTELVSDAGQNNQSSSDSDSDVMILDANPSKSDTPCVVLDGDEEEVKNFSSRGHCPQLKQLLEVLKQPYCKSELLAHMKEFRLRRPLMGHYDLRSGHKLYETEFVGRSYADWHRDLADQIRTSKEEPKTLNLLRGFFYWLQHSTHGYMDKPWKDPACLSVLPAGAIGATSLFDNEKP